ncbi:ABC transporter ATP-binding protein [Oryzibacter oryziterrae]|uniref:ABC transporter ATP-binding protein n=1 Tax=Oryzibacter oryziterrae TaxID=2766474 RepID=UPI001F37CDD9|nr:ABC transporter ATP-binding protein [Oryzibacter oryziterrae]
MNAPLKSLLSFAGLGRKRQEPRSSRTVPADNARRNIALDIKNVSHHFDIAGSPLAVLDNVTISVKPGEFVALLGPSGCGKSTLLRLAAGLDTPSRGSLLEEGQPIDGPDPSRLLVFQDPTLFPWRTVWRNVATGLEARGLLDTESARVDNALKLVKLDKFADAYPHQLSGGMAQRVAIARALVNDPHLLLLDEPFGKLDSLTRMTLQAELTKLWQEVGFTAILVTHDVEEALLLANRVIVFSDRPARIVAEFEVDKPYPRHRDDTDLVHLRQTILGQLGIAND